MSELITKYDDITGNFKTLLGSSVSYTDEEFTATGGGQTVFVLAGTIDAETKLDVWVNGQKQFEGAGLDWTRDIINDEVEFNNAIPDNSFVVIRVWA